MPKEEHLIIFYNSNPNQTKETVGMQGRIAKMT